MHSLETSMWERRPRRDSSRLYRGEDAAPTQVPSEIATPRILLMRESGFMFKLAKAEKQEVVTAGTGPCWRKLKERRKKESNETVTNCHGLKMRAAGGLDCITAPRRLAETDFVIVAVPTPVDATRRPDLQSFLAASTQNVARAHP